MAFEKREACRGMEGSSSSSSKSGMVVVANERKPGGGIRIGNPFTLKVGQVFTGFGIGCGVGIGVGRPINLGTHTPLLNNYLSLSVCCVAFLCFEL